MKKILKHIKVAEKPLLDSTQSVARTKELRAYAFNIIEKIIMHEWQYRRRVNITSICEDLFQEKWIETTFKSAENDPIANGSVKPNATYDTIIVDVHYKPRTKKEYSELIKMLNELQEKGTYPQHNT